MHRIDDPTATPTLPAPRPQGTPGYFTGGSPGSGGFAATVVRYEFMNALQEELVAVILAAGLSLDKTDNTQLLQALQKALRFKLFQDTTFYVSPTGSDSNDGLTPGTALASGEAAWKKAFALDVNGHNLTIQFANGTYTQPIVCQGIVLGLGAGNSITFVGNISQPNLVNINITNGDCFTVNNGAHIFVRGMTLAASGVSSNYVSQGHAFVATQESSIVYGNVIFAACGTAHCIALGGFIDSEASPYTISGSSPNHVLSYGGSCNLAQSAVTLTGNPTFSSAFAEAAALGTIDAAGAAFSGAATGPRYLSTQNSLINTNGGGLTFFPGNANGTTDTGGLYV